MLRREIPLPIVIIVIAVALLIAGIILWRGTTRGGEIILEKAEKPYPVPPIFQKPPPGR
jgi:hypothetical protein